MLMATLVLLLLGFMRHVRGETATGDQAGTPPAEMTPEEMILEFPQDAYSLRPQPRSACEIPCRVLDPLDQCPLWTGHLILGGKPNPVALVAATGKVCQMG